MVYTADTLSQSSARYAAVFNSDNTNTASWFVGENTQLRVLPEGPVIVSDADNAPVAIVGAPWAVDANGRLLNTHFTAEGNKLVQHVELASDTAFPVIADPAITVGLAGASDGPGVYWNMTGAQAKAVGAVSVATLGTAIAGGCVGAGKIPRVGFLIQGACGFVGVPTLKSVWASVTKIMRNTNINNNACYQIKVYPAGKTLKKVSAKNCA